MSETTETNLEKPTGDESWVDDAPSPLESADHLFRRLRGPAEEIRGHDRAALRDHLVLKHAPLVEYCARNYLVAGEPLEDLVQEGYIGLVKAVDRFDPDKGNKFSTYACHLISGEIRHYLRDLGRLIHEPGWHNELRQRIARASDQLAVTLDRTPTPEEIAEALNIKPASVRDVLKNQQVLQVDSLENQLRDDESGSSDWSDALPDNDEPQESLADNQMVLGAALPQLKELEKRAVTLFFFAEKSKTEIAREMGISINYAAYLIKQGLDHLREIIEMSEVERSGAIASVTAPLAQQVARATYLLEIAKTASRGSESADRRRPAETVPSVPAVGRKRVASLVEFAGWLDEEVLRANRYDHEFGVLWLQISNWAEATSGIGETGAARAANAVQKLVRRSCRAVDKMAVAPPGALPGLNIFVLMPHSGAIGEKAGHRWRELCTPLNVFPTNPEALGNLQLEIGFALFPRDGKSADELFARLGQTVLANPKTT